MTTTLKKLALGLLPLLLLLGLAEGGARALEPLLWGTSYPGGQPTGLYEVRDGRPQLIRGAELPGVLVDVRVNSWGFRDDEVIEPRPEQALRVWVVGGSTTFDIYARDNASAWPNLLEQRLQRALPGRRVEVLNAGIPGETLMGSGDDLERLGERFQPDLVLLYHGPNDLRHEAMQPLLQRGPAPVKGVDWSRVAGSIALTRLLARVSQPALFTGGGRFDPESGLRSAREGLSRAIELSRGLGATPVLATHPLRIVLDDQGQLGREMHELSQHLLLPPEQSVAAYQAYNEYVRGLAVSEELPLVEVAQAVDSSPENWGDLTHFRRPGAELCADEVARVLLASPDLLRPR